MKEGLAWNPRIDFVEGRSQVGVVVDRVAQNPWEEVGGWHQ